MSIQIHNAVYVPDLDSASIPGAVVSMQGWAPLQNGLYASAGISSIFDLEDTDVLTAMVFPNLDGATARMLVFTPTAITEYANDGTQVGVQGSGYSGSTTSWDAAAWGAQIIAVRSKDENAGAIEAPEVQYDDMSPIEED
jgi:hypothetical protein